jgi:hypothetical protein
MEFARFTDLAAELQLWIARAMGADATLKELMSFEEQCGLQGVSFTPLFAEWLGEQEAGVVLGQFAGGKEDILFVTRHIEGEHICLT